MHRVPQGGYRNVLSQSYVREFKRFQTKIDSPANETVGNIAKSHKLLQTMVEHDVPVIVT